MAKVSAIEIPSLLFAEQGSNPATPATGFGRLFVKADGVYFIDDAGTVVGPLGTGGGGSTGGILAVTSYNPGTLASYSRAGSSASYADIDATNLAVTFTAPSSGDVLVRLTGLCGISSGASNQVFWNLRESTSDLAGTDAQIVNAAAVSNTMKSHACVVTGLTAGNSYTYKWGWKPTGSGGTGQINFFAGSGGGPATMEVHALP